MRIKQARAVVRSVDAPPAKTEWFPAGSEEAFEAMVALLPRSGNFTVIWEEREVDVTAGTSQA